MKTIQSLSVPAAISRAVSSSAEGRERLRALRAVHWVLRSGSFYVGPVDARTLQTPLVPSVAEALVFDGCDNEEARAAFFSREFGAPFVAELVVERPAATVGEIRAFALKLRDAGFVSVKGMPKDRAFPLVPQVVADRYGVGLLLARQAVHCLHAWGLGLAKVGEYHPL